MMRIKVYQRTELEHTNPRPQFVEFDESKLHQEGLLFHVIPYAAALGVQRLLATDGPEAPIYGSVEASNIAVRRIVCTHPNIAGDVVVEFPSPHGYLSDQRPTSSE